MPLLVLVTVVVVFTFSGLDPGDDPLEVLVHPREDCGPAPSALLLPEGVDAHQ